MVVFAQHNLITDAPFTRVDLITCRNLLIYFQPHGAAQGALALALRAQDRRHAASSARRRRRARSADEFDTVDGTGGIYAQAARRAPARHPPAAADRRLPDGGARAAAARLRGARSWTRLAAHGPLRSAARRAPCRPACSSTSTTTWCTPSAAPSRCCASRAGARRPTCSTSSTTTSRRRCSGALQHANKERAHGAPGAASRCRRPAAPRSIGSPSSRSARRSGSMHFLVQYENKGPTALTQATEAAVDVPRAVARLRLGARVGAALHQGEPAGDDRGAGDGERRAAGDERGARRLERGAAVAPTRSCTRSTKSSTRSTSSTSARSRSSARPPTTSTTCCTRIDVGVMFLDDKLCIRKYTSQIAQRVPPPAAGRRAAASTASRRPSSTPGSRTTSCRCSQDGQPIVREVTSRERRHYLLRILPYRSTSQQARRRRHAHRHQRAQAQRGARAPAVVSIVESVDRRHHSRRSRAARSQNWNRGAAAALRLRRRRGASGATSSFLMPDEQRSECASTSCGASSAATSVEPFETTMRRKDGGTVDVQISRVAAAQRARPRHRRLVDRARHHAAPARRAGDPRALKMRDQFMAMLSHELRNPLAALLHASTLVLERRITATP